METTNTANSRDSGPQENDKDHTDDEEEEFHVDPFQHSLSMTTAQWAQTIILGIILVPLRLMLILFFMLIMWIISSVSLRLVAKGKDTFLFLVSRYSGKKMPENTRCFIFL